MPLSGKVVCTKVSKHILEKSKDDCICEGNVKEYKDGIFTLTVL